MNLSTDNAEIVAQIQQQCMQEARREYEATVQDTDLQLQRLQAIIVQLTKDNAEVKQFLSAKLHEVGELNIRTNELQQKLTESERNLHDVIRSYDAERDRLKDQLSNQGVELNKKHEEISVLLKQHNDLVHKNREYEQTIALLMKDRKHCNCKRSDTEVMIGVPASMTIDLLSSSNLQQNLSQLPGAKNHLEDYRHPVSKGVLRSGGGVEKEKVDLTVASSSSLSDHYLHQNLSQLSLTRKSDDHPEGNTHILGLQCTHFNTEHMAMANNILQTTFEAMPYCKANIGTRHCRATESVNMCLKCGALRCINHLHEFHDKKHTVFMMMMSKTVWCCSCQCNSVADHVYNATPQPKERSPNKSKISEKNKFRQQPYSIKESKKYIRKSPDCYIGGHHRSKSPSQSPNEAKITTAAQQVPSHNSPVANWLPASISSVTTSTETYLPSRRLSTDRKSPISSDIMSSAPPTYHDRSSSYLNNVASAAENRMLSSSTLAKETTNNITKSTVLVSGSLPSLSEPTVAMVDTSAAAPRVAGKPLKSVGNENKPSGGNVADSVKTNLKNQTPINKKILTSTASTTPIVPATKPLYTDTWKYPTTPTMSRSQTAYNNTSAKSTSSVKSSTLPASTSRSSTNSSHCHRRSSSFHKIHDNQPTSSTSEIESSLPRSMSKYSTAEARPRSWSFENQHLPYDLPPFKGLVNTGLSCFFNAAVQGLSRINPFNKLLTKLFKPGELVKVNLKKQDSCIHVTILRGEHGEISEHLSRTIAFIRKPPAYRHDTCFDPSALLSSIQAKYRNSFRPYRQGDAHEVMRCVLDAVRMEEIEKIKKAIRKEYTGSENGSIETLQDGHEKLSCKAALHGANKVRTYIDQVIGGELLSVVVCADCQHKVELVEPFLDISLPIPDKRDYHYTSSSYATSLKECFKEYVSEDVLDNDNKFICSNCSGKGDDIQLRNAIKQLKLHALPEVFIIHLKRFSIDHIVTKNSSRVKYPIMIDVKPYCTEQLLTNKRQSTHYSLFAVIQHIGTLNFGHYTAYIKMSDDQWYKADDSLVTKVQEGEALKQEAYILFYQQIGNS